MHQLLLTLVVACPGAPASFDDLDRFVAAEVADKRLPALSIAVVDDQKVLWSKGYGFEDKAGKKPASADTVYRVGSVSKLFTDVAVMQLVEQGRLDLDAPVTKYLPDFKPISPFDKPITLRMLMCHRAGLVREPPVGNYFDPSVRALDRTVKSLNATEMVHEPGTKTKYSNAGIAVVGFVLESTQGQPFGRYLQNRILLPLGMERSAFEPTLPAAHVLMWTYHGREFDAPTFELGMAPAGSLYSTAADLSKFLSTLFADGRDMLKPETLEAMYKPQFAKEGDKTGFGIGFHVTELDGRRRIGHGGAIYGFATELAFLPAEKLGVVVIASRDCANGCTSRVANVALRQALADRDKKPRPIVEPFKPVEPETARKLAGRYLKDGKGVELSEHDGKLHTQSLQGGPRVQLKRQGDDFVVDDPQRFGARFVHKDDTLTLGKETYTRVKDEQPAPPPAKWLGLIGEYGWDHNVLYVYEKDGRLWTLIEWFEHYPLEEVTPDVYKFPDLGLYPGEKLIFTRDKAGRASKVEAASVVFERRTIDGEEGRTFKIKPLKPVAELRALAAKATPPTETGLLNKPDLVELTALDPTIRLDVRYATTNNFLGEPLYTSAKAFLQKPAAEALVRVHKAIAKDGYGLLVHDGYRPWAVTKMFWEATPEAQRIFVADPSKGSRHNRGCAVDLTLYDLTTGKAVEMTGGYDEFSDRSYPDYPAGTSLQRWRRQFLRRAMAAEGFAVYEAEWWHYDYKDWKKYPILNIRFEEVKVR